MGTENQGDEFELELEDLDIEPSVDDVMEIDFDDDLVLEPDEDLDMEIDLELDLELEDDSSTVQEDNALIIKSRTDSLQVRTEKSIKAFENMSKSNGEVATVISNAIERSFSIPEENKSISIIKNLIKGHNYGFDTKLLLDVIKNIPNIDRTSRETLKESLDRIGIDSSITNSVFNLMKLNNFLDAADNALKFAASDELDVRRRNFSTQFTGSLLSLFSDNFLKNSKKATNGEYRTDLLNQIRLTPDKVYYTCPECGKEYELDSPLVAYVYSSSSVKRICAYMVCDDCGIILTPTVKDLEKMDRFVHNLSSQTSNSFTGKNTQFNELSACELYVPSNYDVATAMGDIAVFDDSVDESGMDDDKVFVDWNLLANNFMKMQEMFYRGMRSGFGESLGIRGVARILAEQSNDYLELKDRALATLISELKSLGLNDLSEFYCNQNRIPLYYGDSLKENCFGLLNLVPTSVTEKRLRTPQGFEEFEKDYRSYCDEENSNPSENRRRELVEQLHRWKISFANLPISPSISLEDEDYQDYLSYEPLAKILDEITDYMIINSCAESYFDYFRPRTASNKKGKNRLDSSYNSRKKRLMDAEDRGSIVGYLIKFTEYFKTAAVSQTDFVLYYASNTELFDRISSYCDDLLQCDFYSANREREIILSKFGGDIDNLCDCDRYAMVENIIKGFTPLDTDVSEFDFYFGDVPGSEDFTENQKEVLLEIRKKKLFVPKEFKGDSTSDKLDYYENLEMPSEMKMPNIKGYLDFVFSNRVAIKGLSLINGRLEFKNSRSYFVGRDLFIAMSRMDLKTFTEFLDLNSEICKFYLDLSFSYVKTDFDYSRLIRVVPFDDLNVRNLQTDSLMNEDDFMKQMSVYYDYLMDEGKKGDLIKNIVESFLSKIKEGE